MNKIATYKCHVLFDRYSSQSRKRNCYNVHVDLGKNIILYNKIWHCEWDNAFVSLESLTFWSFSTPHVPYTPDKYMESSRRPVQGGSLMLSAIRRRVNKLAVMTLQFVRSPVPCERVRNSVYTCVSACVCVLHMWHARVKIVTRCTWSRQVYARLIYIYVHLLCAC